uniref:Uncharacterized protein n=1 Tax=Chromera velia CCMP2878 TaxID=1169474 RepID=A0A0G4HIB1_9ALVE|eukprot:Cvel_27872.t1-p1 / transcript=Cvel_27872.t1 / gene=Cvel_27872 / organism=Chromera_velia_CCMP2878 / gene_product=hypothetical protein / transcript_product=hypothetical protein / location=Cvel_scaffold3548:1964-2173(-) / protein_length=70 / sequence_SO=supercontig / SO=protein_coding / is_pseudo=false
MLALQQNQQQFQQILEGVVAAQTNAAAPPVFPTEEDALPSAASQGPEVEERKQVPRITLVKPETFTGRRD